MGVRERERGGRKEARRKRAGHTRCGIEGREARGKKESEEAIYGIAYKVNKNWQ